MFFYWCYFVELSVGGGMRGEEENKWGREGMGSGGGALMSQEGSDTALSMPSMVPGCRFLGSAQGVL
jgi:hypothetical protein